MISVCNLALLLWFSIFLIVFNHDAYNYDFIVQDKVQGRDDSINHDDNDG